MSCKNSLSHLRSITVVPDPIHGSFDLNIFDRDLVDSPYFQRLHYVYQNSANYVSFPSNKNSRFTHSLGVSHTAGKMFGKALSNSSYEDVSVFLDKAADFIENLTVLISGMEIREDEEEVDTNQERHEFQFAHFETLSGLSGFVHTPILPGELNNRIDTEQMCGRNKKYSAAFVADTLWQSLKIYGLMHDLGHLPMSHAFELGLEKACRRSTHYGLDEAKKSQLDELIANVKSGIIEEGRDKELRDDLFNKMAEYLSVDKWKIKPEAFEYIGSKKEIHEARGLNLFLRFVRRHSNVSKSCQLPGHVSEKSITGYANLIYLITFSMYFSKSIVQEYKNTEPENELHPYAFLYSMRHIVDGTVDADRIDYTLRDIHEAGARLGTFDIDRVVRNTLLIKDSKTDRFSFGFHFRAIPGIEQFFESRYQAYKYVINSRTSARTYKCIEYLISLLLIHSVMQPDGIVGKNFRLFGYSSFEDGKTTFLPEEDDSINRIDDSTFRSLLLRINYKYKKLKKKQQETPAKSLLSVEESKILEEIHNLTNIILFRDYDHIFSLTKNETFSSFVAGVSPTIKNNATLQRAFAKYVLNRREHVKTRKVKKDVIEKVAELTDPFDAYVAFHIIKSKGYFVKHDIKLEGVDCRTFESRIHVKDAKGQIKNIDDMSELLRRMNQKVVDEVDLRAYAVYRNIKTDVGLQDNILGALNSALKALWNDYRKTKEYKDINGNGSKTT